METIILKSEKEEKPLYLKKGQIQDITGGIVTLIVGIGVAVLVLIFVGALGGQTYELVEDDIDAIANNAIVDDAFTALNGTIVRLDHSFIQEGSLGIWNNSGVDRVGLANFTIDYDAGTVLLNPTANYATYNNSIMHANYTWGASEIRISIKNSIVSGFEALETTGNYLPIIVLAVVIAIVLTLVIGFTAFRNAGQGGAGTAL